MEMRSPKRRSCAGYIAIRGQALIRTAMRFLLTRWIVSSKVWLY